jgi:hypothetical protein
MYVQSFRGCHNKITIQYWRAIDLLALPSVRMLWGGFEFVYVLQHDTPRFQDINNTAILKTMDEYPDVLRIVRFNLESNF